MDWIHLAQDTEKCRFIVNMTIGILAAANAANFFISLVITRFSEGLCSMEIVRQLMVRNVNHEFSSEHGMVTVAAPVFPVQSAMSYHA